MKDRVKWIDFLSGVLTLWTILYHIFILTANKQTAACEGLYRVFFFFMPWFFFKSGMFAKKASLKSSIKSASVKLLVPYIIFSVLGFAVYAVQQLVLNDISVGKMLVEPAKVLLLTGSIPGNLPLWFLLALFFDKVLWQLFTNLHLNSIQIAALSFLICFGGYLSGIKQPFYLWYTFSGLFFYSLGDILKNIQFNRAVFVVSLALYLIAIFVFPNSVQIRSNALEAGHYCLWPFAGVSAIIVWNNISRYLGEAKRKVAVLEKLYSGTRSVGEDSLYLYVTHALVIVLACAIFSQTFQSAGLFWITLLACVVLLPLFSFGAKKLLRIIAI